MDATTFTEWFLNYKIGLYLYAYKKMGNHDLAEDLVQEVYIAALESPQVSQIQNVKAWLFGILKNKIAAFYQKQDFHLSLETIPDIKIITKFSPDLEFEKQEIQKSIFFCLSRLSPVKAKIFREKELTESRKYEQETVKEDISSGNIRVILHRAKAELKRCLKILGFGN